MGVILYNLILILCIPVALPLFGLLTLFHADYRYGFIERLGSIPADWRRRRKDERRIWIHAASVGECQAVRPLIDLMLREQAGWKIYLSVMTPTGQRFALEWLGERAKVFFFPLDFPGLSTRVMRALDPEIILLAETELWPNFLHEASRRDIPVMLVNGRISARSYARYRWVGWLFAGTMKKIQSFCVQTSADAGRLIRLGAPPERVRVTGNLKFDQTVSPMPETEATRLLSRLGWNPGDPILVAASTHEKEEEILLACFRQVREKVPGLRLIIAPRHLNRIMDVLGLIVRSGEAYVRYSDLDQGQPEKDAGILIVDTLGDLVGLYGLATVVFVGGTLVPVGGHNLLEPASLGIPVLFGPHVETVLEVAEQLSRSGGGKMVRDAEDLSRHLHELFSQLDQRRRMGERALSMVGKYKGSSLRVFGEIEEQLGTASLKRVPKLDFRSGIERWFKDRILVSRSGFISFIPLMILGWMAFAYKGIQAFRVAAYSNGWLRMVRLDRPVISIGNLTLGGTGKTPAVMIVSQYLAKRGCRPAVLSRGYGGKSTEKLRVVSGLERQPEEPRKAGDEPCLIAERLPNVPVIVSRDRVAAGNHAIRNLQSGILVLDDGYQYLRLQRDLNLLLIDFNQPFGNGYVLPRGNLRESLGQLRRADAVLLTHVKDVALTEEFQRVIRRYRMDMPIFTSRYRPVQLTNLSSGQTEPLDGVSHNRVMAVSGIGSPDSFLQLLKCLDSDIAVACIFPDHYAFGRKDLEALEREARRLEVRKIVTTEKDAVRLRTLSKPLEGWWSIQIEMIIDQVEAFESMLCGAVR